MGAALLLSGSRGGLVALLVEVVLLVILTSRAKGTKGLLLKAALSVFLVTAALGGAIFVGGDTSLTRITSEAASDDVSASRFKIWRTTIEVIRENAPLGAGLGAFPQAYTRFDPDSGQWTVHQAHNDYLQLAADAGIVGIGIGGLFLFWFVRQGARSIRADDQLHRGIAVGALAGCVAILTHSLFDFVLHITAVSVLFLLLLALLVSAGREYQREAAPKARSKRRSSVTPISARSLN
jgi:O-antigen ligase